jgi:hypothetical protein
LDLLFVVSIHHNFPTMNLLPKFSIILIFSHMYNRENQHNKKKHHITTFYADQYVYFQMRK